MTIASLKINKKDSKINNNVLRMSLRPHIQEFGPFNYIPYCNSFKNHLPSLPCACDRVS